MGIVSEYVRPEATLRYFPRRAAVRDDQGRWDRGVIRTNPTNRRPQLVQELQRLVPTE